MVLELLGKRGFLLLYENSDRPPFSYRTVYIDESVSNAEFAGYMFS